MKKSALLLGLCLLFVFAACNKENCVTIFFWQDSNGVVYSSETACENQSGGTCSEICEVVCE